MSDQALARHTDPETSHDAADSVPATKLEAKILAVLKGIARPGATTEELAQLTQLSLVTVSPRMKPMQRKHLVVDSGFRRRGLSGRNQIIWRAL